MNSWHKRFQTEEYVYGMNPNVFIVEALAKVDLTGHILTIAEGEGRNAVYLAEKGLEVTSWDYALSGLEKTLKLAGTRSVEVDTKLIDLNDALWESESWDGVVCVFGHFPKPLRDKTLRGVKEAIKPGGYYISEVYSTDQLPYESGGPKDIELLYSAEELLTTFSDWKIIHFFTGEVMREEGELHKGLSHVVQVIAQKPKKEQK
ncbi:class I SAM-dependent methyltransferase [Alkalihalophilus pseudofirmus]|uniref:Class I SAM-dependent methyltransferase n=1 Tax=Alkalihalophilus pseudofirmus TaxID=79885 RepID=A0AAJ2NK40_ALKPS|nr:class I SAM-dependent methyltransferase [Alkalihalophilus pseudofirmus]MDV2883791.1 class I SAM-dependent methyltransferase [Alkalihalophilus pseudofirmus]